MFPSRSLLPMNSSREVPNPAVKRLSLYLRQLESLDAQGVKTLSSHRLAESLDLTDAQVRKDLAYFGQFGRPGVGYEVQPLIHRLRTILGTDRISNTLLIGAGNIGKALASYQGFRPKGFDLVAVFDSDERKVGKKVAGFSIMSMKQLHEVIQQHNIRLGILAVPAEAAQFVAEQLIAHGVRGILNFAPVRLQVPPEVTVRSVDVAAELEQLSFRAHLK
jgi:redox-sensing transcriptional repressor